MDRSRAPAPTIRSEAFRLNMKILLAILLLAGSLSAQDQTATADNPLATLKDEVKRVLTEAQVPFTDEQDQAIVLMMEDRRKASEDLFGELLDFRAGPTQGRRPIACARRSNGCATSFSSGLPTT